MKNGHTTKCLVLMVAAMLLMAPFCRAQQIKTDAQLDRDMTGDPVVSYSKFYTGMVAYDGEMIPSFLYSDFYVFKPLVFKNPSQARKYYKIANNIKKVYPLACEIQQTVNSTIAHMDSLPTKKEKDAYLKQQEKDLKAIYYPKLKKLTFAQGKLLIKLIDRQCDMTGYELIKKYMGGFKAGFYNAFASLFGASLKKEYDPEVDDRLTERAILLIESGQM
ncbi:MAG: DUF4294 domain-containing protein [Bacteroidaceae bacterium]|nr:DUF4294 domain-containing protein [Bacteroidaceae bacterium]MDO5481634.1 DUF4294 domain-containing protein [Bacteroidaceae bacterium]